MEQYIPENNLEKNSELAEQIYSAVLSDLESRLSGAGDTDIIDIKLSGMVDTQHFTIECETSKAEFVDILEKKIKEKIQTISTGTLTHLDRAVSIYSADQKDVDPVLRVEKSGGYTTLIG